jgi:valyl-tRNA synthetase
VVEWFRKNRLLEDVKPYRHSVGHSYRSHVPIEPYLSDQWYCKVTDDRLAGAALRAMAQREGSPPSPGSPGEGRGDGWQGQLRFYPARYAKTFQSWHENLRDWCISRQLWWGHRIPVWRNPKGLAEGYKLTFGNNPDASREIQHLDNLRLLVSAGRIAATKGLEYVCLRDDSDLEVKKELEDWGWEQDPDVLDTWFSSGLWPMSTMGWPNETLELAKWNPTSVLCTAREIITLWVSRMTMFNLYLLDRLPFRDVFIHAMIQDGEGRKMSKTLGNGVDPLDIIESHGTDAMRFTLASMATNTQDVRMPVEKDSTTGKNTSPKFDLGRNFCNKLWNAARFVLMSIEKLKPETVDELKWSMADRWIVSRFNRTAAECHDALANYRFDQYAKACYDFFWGDFCDWYVEASKPAMKDAARAGQTANVLAATLDGSLRLLHPIVPFITEQIWQRLCAVRPGKREIHSRIEGSDSPLCIRALFPIDSKNYSDAAEHIWPRLQEIVISIRNARNDYKVDAKRPVTVSIKAPGDSARQILAHQPEIELLAICKLANAAPDATAPRDSTKLIAAGCEVYLEGLVDKAAEEARAGKRREELLRQESALKGRLENAGYLAKAPPHLVQQTRDQLSQVQAELAKLG